MQTELGTADEAEHGQEPAVNDNETANTPVVEALPSETDLDSFVEDLLRTYYEPIMSEEVPRHLIDLVMTWPARENDREDEPASPM